MGDASPQELQANPNFLQGKGASFQGPVEMTIGDSSFLIIQRQERKIDRGNVYVFSGRDLAAIARDRINFGRQEGNQWIVPDPKVSRTHGYIQPQPDSFYLFDKGSTNGTKVKPVTEAPDKPVEVPRGGKSSWTLLGDSPVIIGLGNKPVQIEKDADGGVFVMVNGRRTTVADSNTTSAEFTFGRDPSNNFVVDDPYVSRQHMRLTYAAGAIQVTDMESKNGTSLHKARLENEKESSPELPNRDQQPKSEKRSQHFNYGVAEDIGMRPSMEDAHAIVRDLGGRKGRDFIAIYDGHGGRGAAELASKNLHKFFLQELARGKTPEKALSDAFEVTDREIETTMDDGATAIVALIDDNKLIVAGAGDARAVLDRNGKAQRLSRDHKPDDPAEKQRIERDGGFVSAGSAYDVARVNRYLAVSRALGDRELGKLVPPTPDVATVDLGRGDGKLILACDGVWDVMADQEAVDLIKNISDPDKASKRLKDEALHRGSSDNVSVIVAVPSR